MQSNVNELIQYMSKVLTKQKRMTTNESMFVHMSSHIVGVNSQWTHGAFLLVSSQCQLRKYYLHSLFIYYNSDDKPFVHMYFFENALKARISLRRSLEKNGCK